MFRRAVRSLFVAVLFLCPGPSWADISDGLIAHWPLDGDAQDASGYGHHGVTHGGVSFVADRNGNPSAAAEFDGVSGRIDIGSGVKPPCPLSVSLWVKLHEDRYETVFTNDLYDNGGYRYGVSLFRGADGVLSAYVFEGFSQPSNRIAYIADGPVAIADDWHHWVVVFHGYNNIQMYWDGVELLGHYSGSGSSLTYSGADGNLGYFMDNEGPVYLEGCLDDVRVYNRSLGANEVFELHGQDSSDLSIRMTGPSDHVTLGDTLVYVLSITNDGPRAASAVVAEDVLPPGVLFLDGLASQGHHTVDDRMVTWSVGTLAAGDSATMTISAALDMLFLEAHASVRSTRYDPHSDDNCTEVYNVVDCMAAAAVGQGTSAPAETDALAVVPNTSTRGFTVKFSASAKQQTSLSVFDVQGRVVRRIRSGQSQTGLQTLEWDGRDEEGRRVPAALYVIQVQTGHSVVARKVVVLR